MYTNSDFDFNFEQPLLSRAVFAGAFTGFVASIVNLAYHLVYRFATDFSPSDFINVSSIIFGTMIVSVIAGFLYYFLGTGRSKTILFYLIFAVIIVLCLVLDITASKNVSREWLLFGLILITGGLVLFMVPYYTKHSDQLV